MWKRGVSIGCTIVGTTIGAGFASGREIWEFFASYGRAGAGGILLAMALFVAACALLLRVGQQVGDGRARSVLAALMGRRWGRLYDGLLLAHWFSLSAVMFAGSGATVAQWGGAYRWGIVAIAVLVWVTVSCGLSGLLTANLLIAPLLIGVLGAVVGTALWNAPPQPAAASAAPSVWGSSVVYAAFNVAPLVAVLAQLGASIRSTGEIVVAAGTSYVVLAGLALLYHAALLASGPEVEAMEIPLFWLARDLPPQTALIVTAVLWLALFSTAISGVYGLTRRIAESTGRSPAAVALVLTASVALVSQFGFASLVGVLYPLYGLCDVALLARVLAYPLALETRRPT
ncbi:MAG TPA: hypothetical protein VIK75_09070 [Calditerricola sp.]|uniref:Membrane protein YkvI n=1 Tax=Calditerricola satsumensis TaxID=373054 RepID=A0A8J3B9A6_9BACI|nr:hypothetical protein [Calditerricola satsumensis]GGJ97238.1 hypothetical protein GCM10007043_08870 [Calditerricola satsumensis]